MKIIDTHSHLNFKAFDKDREEVIKRTSKAGVICIDVGTKYETSKHAVELAEKNENIFSAIGLHPIHADEGFDVERYMDLAKSKKVVAIGEIGLDAKYPSPKQKEFFLKQFDLARELDLPIILHCRMAHDDLLKILNSQIALSYKKIKGVIHCFTGSIKEMEQYLNLGLYIGLNGIIFKLNIDQVIKKCPLDKILVETDCPYLTPPVEGKAARNEPIFVKHVIQKIAEIKGLSFEEVANQTTQNARELFKI